MHLGKGSFLTLIKSKHFIVEFFEQVSSFTSKQLVSSDNFSGSSSNAKRPTIELPKLKGDYEMFATFKHIFIA